RRGPVGLRLRSALPGLPFFLWRALRSPSPHGSELRAYGLGTFSLRVVVLCLFCSLSAGCVMVRPEQREHLADSAMTFGSEGTASAHEEHVLTNREGTYGAGAVTGGGCGCN